MQIKAFPYLASCVSHLASRTSYLVLLAILLLASCETDSYDKGEGQYSLMQADFVEAHTDADCRVSYVLTDEGDSLLAEPRFTTSAIGRADTAYRAILYYDRVGTQGFKARSFSLVPTLRPMLADTLERVLTDPLKLESLWRPNRGRYVNMGVLLMSGLPDTDDQRHAVGLVLDSVQRHADGLATACCRLYHDQGGVPEYYSVRRYLSIPVSALDADSLRLAVTTYNGVVVKTVPL